MANRLIGKWRSDLTDAPTRDTYGDVTMRFHDDGRLTYIAHSEKKDEVIKLTYSVDLDELVTDQPTAPSEHRTKFSFDEKGRLVLDDAGERSVFLKVK